MLILAWLLDKLIGRILALGLPVLVGVLPASAEDYLYMRTSEVTVGFERMLGFGLSLKKVDTMCEAGKCHEIPKSFEHVDEYDTTNKRCFIRFGSGVTGSFLKPDFYMGDEKVTGNPSYITFLCRRVDIGSNQANIAEAQYNACMRSSGAEPKNASVAMRILGDASALAKQGLEREQLNRRLLRNYDMADIDMALKWYEAHQMCFPQAYPDPEKFSQ